MPTSTLFATAEPASTALSLADAKAHLRVDDSASDGQIADYVATAESLIGLHTGRPHGLTTYRWTFDRWPAPDAPLELPRRPTDQILAVKFAEFAGGAYDVWPSTKWWHDADGARIFATAGWPAGRSLPQVGRVEFRAGYATVPPPLEQAVKLLVGHWFLNRAAAETLTFSPLPFAVDCLIAPYRNWQFRA